MTRGDTIVAAATPPGMGGIGIVRMSGPEAEAILHTVFRPAGKHTDLPDHRLTYGKLQDGDEEIDECMAVLMKGPHSYTRENVVEFQLHAGSYIIHRVVEMCIAHGARLAEAGEFTRRAFLNGRIDLSEAEAVMRMITARSSQEHRAAVRQMNGGAASMARSIADRLYQLQAGLAACIDYPEEISEQEGTDALRPGLRNLIEEIGALCNEKAGQMLFNGLQVALIGRPNVGKSSLLNALVREERAIVTDIPGTTRDLVHGELTINGIRVRITDTAGIRESADPVESAGVRRTMKTAGEADVVFLVLDGSAEMTEEDLRLIRTVEQTDAVILNKSDLPQRIDPSKIPGIPESLPVYRVSALQDRTLDRIREDLVRRTKEADLNGFSQPRHIDALKRAKRALEDALQTLDVYTPDMASTDLQAAQNALSEITGDRADEKLLDTVFSEFCVGK